MNDGGDRMSEENDKIRDRFNFHREEILHVAGQLEDIRDGRIREAAINTELDALAGHLQQVAKRLKATEVLVLTRLSRIDLDKLASGQSQLEDRLNELEGRIHAGRGEAFIQEPELAGEIMSILELLKTADLPTLSSNYLLGQLRELKAEVIAARSVED